MSKEELDDLARLLKRDREMLAYPARDWVRSRQSSSKNNILDCLIIGGGQSGLGVANGLLQDRVTNILVIDENTKDQEGPWRRFARMPHLRTPKYLTGLDYGNPHLTFQAYYEAKYGHTAYEELGFIPTNVWADYLWWYRIEQSIPVKNRTRAGSIHYDTHEKCLSVPYQSPDAEGTLLAKTIVLANGIDGSGQWQCPKLITDNLPHHRFAHTREAIDFQALNGLRVGVLGAGASAFGNALLALQAGASSVHLFSRRKPLPHINPYRWAEFVGFLKHHGDLDDVMRQKLIARVIDMGQLPPKATIERVLLHKNFHLELGQEWLDAIMVEEEIRVETKKAQFCFDYVLVGTGFVTDLSLRPELTLVHEKIARWSDRTFSSSELMPTDLARHPYLGPSFEFTEKKPGDAPYLSSIFLYNFGALLSLGLGAGSISGLKYSLPKVVAGVTKRLFVDDSEQYFRELCNFELLEYEPGFGQ